MANPAPTINQINAFNATQGTTIDFNIIGGTELIRSNRIYIYDLSDNSLICTHLYVSTESIHELPANTDGSIVYESGKSSADFVNGAQYYAQIQTYTDTNGTQGGSGLSVAKMFWCLGDPTLTITTIPSTISTTSYNISATYTDTSASVVSNIIQQYQFNLYSATGSLLQSSGVVVGSGMQQGTSDVYDISYNFTGLNVGSSYYVTVDVTTTQGMSVNAQSGTFTVSIDTPTLGEATVVNNACDGYISVTSNLSGEYGGSGSGEIVSFETDSEDIFSKLQVDLEPIQEGSGTPSPTNVRPIKGHSGVDVNIKGKNLFDGNAYRCAINTNIAYLVGNAPITSPFTNPNIYNGVGFVCNLEGGKTYALSTDVDGAEDKIFWALYETEEGARSYSNNIKNGASNSPTFTTDTDCVLVFMRYADTAQVVNWTYAQVELGSTATPYEPYQQPQTITQDFNVSPTPTSTDTTPYLFKAVGDVYGDRLEDKIVGGTVAWNQLAGSFRLYGSKGTVEISDNKYTYTFTALGATQYDNSIASTNRFNSVSGHKYLELFDVFCTKAFTVSIGTIADNWIYAKVTANVKERKGVIINGNGTTPFLYVGAGMNYDNTFAVGDTFEVSNIQLFDLTQMFGSTIADYIYSLEQAQAGAGVAWFKKLFPNDYYAYNAGELLSVEGLQSHDTVGFNLLDANTVFTDIGLVKQSDGSWYGQSSPAFSGKPVWENEIGYSGQICVTYKYKFGDPSKVGTRFLFTYTDGTKDELYVDPTTSFVEASFTSASNKVVKNVELTFGSSRVDTYLLDVCINLSNPSRNGEYEPYEKHSYPLDSSLTLRGIPKLDASKNLYYDGDEYTSDGKVKRKYGVVDLGTIAWVQGGGNNKTSWVPVSWRTNVKPVQNTEVQANILCSKYKTDTSEHVEKQVNDKTIAVNRSGWVYIYDSAYVSVTPQEFKEAMSGVYLVYELATPTTETATPYTNPQIVSKYGTLEYVTNSIVPVGHKTTYLTRDIFGGYVDLISGKLVVDRKTILLDGTQSFGDSRPAQNPNGGYNAWFKYDDIGMGDVKRSNPVDNPKLSNRFVYTPRKATAQNDIPIGSFSGNVLSSGNADDWIVFAFDSSMNTYEKISQWFKDNNTQICYELATPQTYQLTPQQVNTLVGTNNVWSEQGNIELSYHIPITNLLVKRQDVDDVSGGWLTLYSQPITQASDMDFTFIDFLNQYGKTYKYALVPLLTQTQSGVEVEVEGGYTVSNEVQSVFDGVFIADSTGSQKCKANVGYGNVDMNQVVGSITPIGAKYPIIITNSHNQYHNGSISGTIVPDDYYFNGNLSRIDMVKKRNELEQFLTNKRVKVIKDWNGNIWLVMIVGNVSCTFNNNYGMGIVDFSTNWTEVGDPTNQQDLQATGLINVGGV